MSAGTAAVYVWEDPGDSIMIQLSLDVVDRLSAAVQASPGTGERGVEIGGILLGRPDPSGGRAVLIEDFELIPCEHARGASYTLSRRDLAVFGTHLERRRESEVVGFFRSHTRPGMYLDQDDFAIVSSYFTDAAQVALLVKPSAEGAPMAGFFFWEEGDINRKAPYKQFPLDREKLLEGDFPVAQHVVAPRTVARPVRRRPALEPSWLTVPLVAGLFMMAGFFFAGARSKARTASAAEPAPVEAPALQVQKAGGALELRWDPNSPAIRKAGLGVLWITDGGQRVRRELDAKELAAGGTRYVPGSNDVNFELQVFSLTQSINRTVKGWTPPKAEPAIQVAKNVTPQMERPVAPTGPAAAPAIQPAGVINTASAANRSSELPRPKAATPTVSKAPVVYGPPKPVRQPVTVAHTAPHELAPPPALTYPAEAQPKLVAMLPPHTVSLPAAPEAEVSYDVPHGSVFKRVFHKITFEGSADGFVPPSPTHKVMPRKAAGADGGVDVKVYVDETGNVARAQLLTKNSEMAEPSLNAARQWRFSPARKHDKPVASEVVLHFRFGSGGDI